MYHIKIYWCIFLADGFTFLFNLHILTSSSQSSLFNPGKNQNTLFFVVLDQLWCSKAFFLKTVPSADTLDNFPPFFQNSFCLMFVGLGYCMICHFCSRWYFTTSTFFVPSHPMPVAEVISKYRETKSIWMLYVPYFRRLYLTSCFWLWNIDWDSTRTFKLYFF